MIPKGIYGSGIKLHCSETGVDSCFTASLKFRGPCYPISFKKSSDEIKPNQHGRTDATYDKSHRAKQNPK